MADHPRPHGGKHFFAAGGVEKFGFFQPVVATALLAVPVVVLATVLGRDDGFVAGFFVGGVREAFVWIHQQ